MTKYEVIWSPIARISYLNILEYLHQNWPEKVTEDFIDRTEEVLNHMERNPFYIAVQKKLTFISVYYQTSEFTISHYTKPG